MPEATSKRRHRVLIIEDQEALALTLIRVLTPRYDLERAGRVRDALARLREARPAFDAVLCDMVLPDGTGIDVFEGVRGEGVAARFVFMTGGALTQEVAEFLDRVPNPKLEKPFPIAALEELLEGVLR